MLPMRATCPAHLIFLDHITMINLVDGKKRKADDLKSLKSLKAVTKKKQELRTLPSLELSACPSACFISETSEWISIKFGTSTVNLY
jgi:hypothetical protein